MIRYALVSLLLKEINSPFIRAKNPVKFTSQDLFIVNGKFINIFPEKHFDDVFDVR